MEGHPSGCSIAVELDVQRCHVRLKSQSRRFSVVSAEGIVDGGILVSNCELRPDVNAFVVRDLADVPGSVATRVPIVAALTLKFSSVEVAVEVHFLAGVVLMDVLARSFKVIHTVLDRVDATCDGVFCYADAVAETPAEQESFFGEVVDRVGVVREVEGFDGRYTSADV